MGKLRFKYLGKKFLSSRTHFGIRLCNSCYETGVEGEQWLKEGVKKWNQASQSHIHPKDQKHFFPISE